MDVSDADDIEDPLHDVVNHLSIVLGFAKLCLDADAAGRRPDRGHLEAIQQAAEAASRLLRPGSALEQAGE